MKTEDMVTVILSLAAECRERAKKAKSEMVKDEWNETAGYLETAAKIADGLGEIP